MKKNKVKIKEKLEESEIRYRRLFETAHDGILILNSKNGQIDDVNPFLEKMLGYSKKEFLKKKLWEVGAFKNMKASRDAFEILQNQGFLRYDHLPLETKDGRLVEVEFVANSYMAGEILVIQCNIRDITERRKIEALKDSKKLFDEEKLKVESIANATHELRTPLAIIKGNIDLAINIKKGGKNPKSALRAINHEVKHLSSILSDLSLITSKAWELKNRIVYKKINIKSLIGTSVKRSKVLAHAKNISVIVKKIPNLVVLGDQEYLEKMLINLIKNSIIYGNKNGSTIVEAKQSKDFVEISVTDNGIGISEDDSQHIFERFYRVNKFSNPSNPNSIGLGLAIVKWIAELHGGQVSVKSSLDKGSVFMVSLPLKTIK